MGEPLTPFATIPRPEDYAAYLEVAQASASSRADALAELDVSEPRTLDASRCARVVSEVIPLPFPSADAATAVESEDDAE